MNPEFEIEYLKHKNTQLVNVLADLSMKLHKMESSLREFEKQRVDPLRDRIQQIETRMDNFNKVNDQYYLEMNFCIKEILNRIGAS